MVTNNTSLLAYLLQTNERLRQLIEEQTIVISNLSTQGQTDSDKNPLTPLIAQLFIYMLDTHQDETPLDTTFIQNLMTAWHYSEQINADPPKLPDTFKIDPEVQLWSEKEGYQAMALLMLHRYANRIYYHIVTQNKLERELEIACFKKFNDGNVYTKATAWIQSILTLTLEQISPTNTVPQTPKMHQIMQGAFPQEGVNLGIPQEFLDTLNRVLDSTPPQISTLYGQLNQMMTHHLEFVPYLPEIAWILQYGYPIGHPLSKNLLLFIKQCRQFHPILIIQLFVTLSKEHHIAPITRRGYTIEPNALRFLNKSVLESLAGEYDLWEALTSYFEASDGSAELTKKSIKRPAPHVSDYATTELFIANYDQQAVVLNEYFIDDLTRIINLILLIIHEGDYAKVWVKEFLGKQYTPDLESLVTMCQQVKATSLDMLFRTIWRGIPTPKFKAVYQQDL